MWQNSLYIVILMILRKSNEIIFLCSHLNDLPNVATHHIKFLLKYRNIRSKYIVILE